MNIEENKIGNHQGMQMIKTVLNHPNSYWGL